MTNTPTRNEPTAVPPVASERGRSCGTRENVGRDGGFAALPVYRPDGLPVYRPGGLRRSLTLVGEWGSEQECRLEEQDVRWWERTLLRQRPGSGRGAGRYTSCTRHLHGE